METATSLKSHSESIKKLWNIADLSIFNLIYAVGLNFFRFMRGLGISYEPNLVVLSSKDNFSCSENELKNARIIVNLKKLNLIKHLDLFLNSLVRILPPGTSFIGYFSDREISDTKGLVHGNLLSVMKRLFSLFRSTKNHAMNRRDVTELLEKNGFKTLNMKEMSGLTYFISRNVSLPR